MVAKKDNMTPAELQAHWDEVEAEVEQARKALRDAMQSRAVIRWTIEEVYGLRITDGGIVNGEI